jgi:hypothetical protein
MPDVVTLSVVTPFAHIARSSRALVTFSPVTNLSKLCVFVTASVTKQARVFVLDQPNIYFQGFSLLEPYTAQGRKYKTKLIVYILSSFIRSGPV